MYPLVLDLAADGIPVTVTCRVLGFSTQAFYKWKSNPVTQRDWDDAHLINAALDIHADDPAFGYRFIADELPGRGIAAGENRVARLCSQERIWSVFAKKRGPEPQGRPTGARRPRRPAVHRCRAEPGLADRHHRTPHRRGQALPLRDQGRLLQPDRRLLHRLADEGLAGGGGAAQRDRAAHSGRHDRASDRGSQFRSKEFVRMLKNNGLLGSMGRVGACGDNAAMESFFALLQKNVLDRQRWTTRDELRLAIVTWIERTYHRRRRQRRLGRLTPIEFEMLHQPVALAA